MTVTFKINSLPGRIALAMATLACSTVFGGIMLSHFVVRTMADRRIMIGREALISAASRLTDSPRVQIRLAEAEMTEPSNPQILAQAQAHARQAVNLSPWNYRYWQALATSQEFIGNSDDSEGALRTASRLAPRYSEVNWALANLMLRQGQLQESLKPFRLAATANRELLPSALDLLWQASSRDVDVLKKLTDGDATLQLPLTQFLVEQSQSDAAVAIYLKIDSIAKINSPSAAAFISSMLEVNPQTARELWLDAVSAIIPQTTGGLIWNGGFEAESLKQFNQFDWMISPSDYARIGFDRGVARGGRRSLRVSFAGRDTTRLEGEIRQLVALTQGRRYRLECYAKAQNLVTPEGPRLALLGRNGVIAVSEPVLAASNEWQNLAIEFTAKLEMMTYVSIVRRPRYDYDEPTRGTIWFDDFKLTEQ
ncbi:MAG: hypothetical protein ABIP14_12030 [Blastocatellia bacterium]